MPDAQVMSDLDATVAWAKGTGKGDTAKLGITGFCWGGRIVWLYAAHNPDLKAGVAWYGRLVGQPTTNCTRDIPIDLAQELKAPVLGLYGGQDQGIPVETVEQMKAGAWHSRQTRRRFVRLPRHAARLLRRLPPQLPQGRGRGRLEAMPRLVERARRRLKTSPRRRPTMAGFCQLQPLHALGPVHGREQFVLKRLVGVNSCRRGAIETEEYQLQRLGHELTLH